MGEELSRVLTVVVDAHEHSQVIKRCIELDTHTHKGVQLKPGHSTRWLDCINVNILGVMVVTPVLGKMLSQKEKVYLKIVNRYKGSN